MELQIIPDPKSNVDELVRFVERISHPPQADQDAVSVAVRAAFGASFEAESNRDGRWEPLAPFTVLDRIMHGFPGAHPILVRTGAMKRTWVELGGEHVRTFTQSASGWILEEGSGSSLAEKHELGIDVPMRAVQPILQDAENNIVSTLERVIEQARRQVIG